LDSGQKVFGLTGGVGMGKSTATTLLAQRGVAIVDTDLLARQLVEPGQPALAEIQQAYGADMLSADGTLRRDLLARRVFSDSAARHMLEAILHPRIRQLWRAQLATWRSKFAQSFSPGLVESSSKQLFFCVVIPLLFETHAETEVDFTICVACSSVTQRQRLTSRGWPSEQIDQRIKSQLPIEEKMARADYVIWNESSLEILAAQIDRILS